MMRIISKTSMEAGFHLGLIALAGLLTLFASIAILVLLPLTLLTLVGGFSIPGHQLSPAVESLAILWFPVALVVAFHNAVIGLEVMNQPSWQGVAKLSFLMMAVILTNPTWWLN